MKFSIDGDQLCITKDDFANLQELPAVFLPLDSDNAKTILRTGEITSIPLGDLIKIRNALDEPSREVSNG